MMMILTDRNCPGPRNTEERQRLTLPPQTKHHNEPRYRQTKGTITHGCHEADAHASANFARKNVFKKWSCDVDLQTSDLKGY